MGKSCEGRIPPQTLHVRSTSRSRILALSLIITQNLTVILSLTSFVPSLTFRDEICFRVPLFVVTIGYRGADV
jgi:hypothetical protein